MNLEARIPEGPLQNQWDRYRFDAKLVNQLFAPVLQQTDEGRKLHQQFRGLVGQLKQR